MLRDKNKKLPEHGRKVIVHCADGTRCIAYRDDGMATGFTIKAPWNYLSATYVESWKYVDEKNNEQKK